MVDQLISRLNCKITEFKYDVTVSPYVNIKWYNGACTNIIMFYTKLAEYPKGQTIHLLELKRAEVNPESVILVAIALSCSRKFNKVWLQA